MGRMSFNTVDASEIHWNGLGGIKHHVNHGDTGYCWYYQLALSSPGFWRLNPNSFSSKNKKWSWPTSKTQTNIITISPQKQLQVHRLCTHIPYIYILILLTIWEKVRLITKSLRCNSVFFFGPKIIRFFQIATPSDRSPPSQEMGNAVPTSNLERWLPQHHRCSNEIDVLILVGRWVYLPTKNHECPL